MTSDIQTIQDFVSSALLAILTSVLVLVGIVVLGFNFLGDGLRDALDPNAPGGGRS